MKVFLLGLVCLLSIIFGGCGSGVGAGAVAGGAADSAADTGAVAAVVSVKPLFKDFMGIDGHVTFKPELYRQVCRLVRSYHDIDWDVRNIGDSLTTPVTWNNINWKRDVYGPWKQNGFETDICLQFGSFGAQNPHLAASWKGKEQWAYYYGKSVAAYFGPSGTEKLATSFEIDNEPGGHFDAGVYRDVFRQMAGGIRAGDPKALILTPYVKAGKTDDYAMGLDGMFADKDILPLYDVINIHTYAQLPQSGTSKNLWNRSYPEDPSLTSYLQAVDEAIAWRDRYARDKKVWITEFGYDACTAGAMKERKDWMLKLDWQGCTDLEQAQYVVRSFLVFGGRNVDRAYLYFYNDADVAAVHSASGLTRNFQPKMSFWAVKQMYEVLGDYRFCRVVRREAGNLYVYEFERGDKFTRGDKEADKIWVAWSPTGVKTQEKEGYRPREVTVTLSGLPGKVEKVVGMATGGGGDSVGEAGGVGNAAGGGAVGGGGVAAGPKWEVAGDSTIRLVVGESPVYIVFKGK